MAEPGDIPSGSTQEKGASPPRGALSTSLEWILNALNCLGSVWIFVLMILINLVYLLRRAQKIRFGSLQAWMTSHIATGILPSCSPSCTERCHPATRPGGTPSGGSSSCS